MDFCAIDAGYYNTNAFKKNGLSEREKIIRSKVQKKESPIQKEDTYIVEIDGVTYEVGEGAEDKDVSLDKTKNEFFKMMILTILSQMTYEKSEVFQIVSNLPINLYNAENKKKMEEYLETGNRFVNLTVNRTQRELKINKVVVFPQVLPIVYVNNISSSPITGLLDFGGVTFQGGICDSKRRMIDSTKFSENMGMIFLQAKIKKELNRVFNVSVKDYEIESVMEYGLVEDVTRSKKVIIEVINDHISKALSVLQEAGWNLKNQPNLLTGGMSLNLSDYLLSKIPNSQLSNDPLRDNVKGLWEVVKAVYHVA